MQLDIPARDHAPGHPKEGWCGETAIQEALLYYGGFVPQRLINKAGKPRMPDLYASDIPVAMRALGLKYRWWNNRGNIHAYIRWIKQQVRAGKPVLVGVKINPTEHPQWGLDHFVLVVGYNSRGLVLNTTWGRRATRSYADLNSRRKGFSFLNRSRRYYALVIDGVAGKHRSSMPIRVTPRSETTRQIRSQITTTGLVPGRRYRLRRFVVGAKKPTVLKSFTAARTSQTFAVPVDKRRASFYTVTTSP